MIIYGFRTRERSVGGGEFPCPCCKFQRSFSEIESRRWFALYFIPLFPVYYLGRHVQCHGCGQTFGLEVLQIATPFQPHPGSVPTATIAAKPMHATAQGMMAPPVMDPSQPYVHGGQPGMATHYPNASHYAPQYAPPPTSGLGIVSMVLGILSPFFFLACGASIFTAIGAVICGHLSLLKKADESGRTPSRGAAIAGLVLGYTFLVLSPIAIYFTYRVYREIESEKQQVAQSGVEGVEENTGRELLHRMEMRVVGASSGAAHGNTDEAKQLAQEFSDSLLRLRDENFTGGSNKGIQLTRGKFVVCCELKKDSCVFVVHVPEFRNYEKDAKEGLADLAWLSAQETAMKKIGPQGALAVGLKGVVMYGAVMVGKREGPPLHREIGEIVNKDPLITFLDLAQKDEEDWIAANSAPDTAEVNRPAASTSTPSVAQGSSFSAPATGTTASGLPSGSNPPVASSPFGTAPMGASSGGGLKPDVKRTTPPKQLPPDREFVASGLPVPKVEILEPFTVAQGRISGKVMAFSSDNRLFAALVDSEFAIFELNGRKLKTVAPYSSELFGVHAVLFTEGSKGLVVGGGSGAIQQWTLPTPSLLQQGNSLMKQSGGISVLATRKNGTFVIGGAGNGLLFWQQIQSGTAGAIRQVQALRITTKDIYLPETRLDFWAVDGIELVQVDLKTAQVKSKVRLDGVYSFDVKFSDDGKYLATSFADELLILDSSSGKIVHRHKAPKRLRDAVEWVPGQNRVLVAIDGGVAIFHPEKGFVSMFPIGDERNRVEEICASQDGSVVAIAARGSNEISTVAIEKPSSN